MSIWTKLSDTVGSAIGNPLRAVIARLTTEGRPLSAERRQMILTAGMIALAAKMAKADGLVSHVEVRAFDQAFAVPPSEQRNVARLFRLAQSTLNGYDGYARQLADAFADEPSALEDVVEALFHVAKADGAVHEREFHYLEAVAGIFGISGRDFERIAARHMISGGPDPYRILGVERGASVAAIKSTYRRRVAELHPDRAIARGLPAELVKVATDRLAATNDAYERIMRERGQ